MSVKNKFKTVTLVPAWYTTIPLFHINPNPLNRVGHVSLGPAVTPTPACSSTVQNLTLSHWKAKANSRNRAQLRFVNGLYSTIDARNIVSCREACDNRLTSFFWFFTIRRNSSGNIDSASNNDGTDEGSRRHKYQAAPTVATMCFCKSKSRTTMKANQQRRPKTNSSQSRWRQSCGPALLSLSAGRPPDGTAVRPTAALSVNK